MSGELDALLERDEFETVFQPIVDGASRAAIGHEALARGPADSVLHLPAALFAAAGQAGRGLELERACLRAALRDFGALGLDGRLFVNVRPQTLVEWTELEGWLRERLDEELIDPHDLVIEVTEHGGAHDEARLAAAVDPLRSLGCSIALDDLGAGASGLKTWSVLRPDYVKIDRYFVADIDRDPIRAEILRSIVDIGRALGSRIVAEGVENEAQCRLVLESGVDHVQGFFLGRPQSCPRIDTRALAAFEAAEGGSVADCAEHLVLSIPAIPRSLPVFEVVDRFRREPAWAALAVVEGDRPVGIVRRDQLLILLSKPLHPEVYNRKPVESVMDRDPVVIDARARLEQVSRLVTGKTDAAQRESFIITRHGAYLGLGRMTDLLRQFTARQIEAAKHSNPLTGLPGNREIESHLAQWLARQRPFIACHLDLDHFKAFNDQYGYARGDQVLLHVAATIARAVHPRVDFVGHVGGDDFVFLLRSQDWSVRLAALREELAASLANFHPVEHREAGGFMGRDRDGVPRRFPLLGASIAAAEVEGTPGTTSEEVVEQLRRAKSAAKAQQGHACMLATRGRIVDLASRPSESRLPEPDTVTLSALAG